MSETKICIVIDASCAIALADPAEEMHAQAVALIRFLSAHDASLIAPALFDYEVETVLRLKVFRFASKAKNAAPFGEKDALSARRIIAALQVETLHNRTWIEAAYDLARTYGQARIYDASYAALARERDLDFWTADEDFYQAVNGAQLPSRKRLKFVRFLGEAPALSISSSP